MIQLLLLCSLLSVLKAQKNSHELKVIWDLDDNIPRDPAEFVALTSPSAGFSPQQASYYFLGERRAPFLEWKALISSVQPLLEQRVKVQFICNSEKIAHWLKEIGIALIGQIIFDPAIKDRVKG